MGHPKPKMTKAEARAWAALARAAQRTLKYAKRRKGGRRG